MSWDAISAIGQMLGSIAVFVTLGYLAVQVRHAHDEMQRSVSQARADGVRQFSSMRATDVRLNALNSKAGAALGAQPNEFIVALKERAGLVEEEAYALYYERMALFQIHIQNILYIEGTRAGERVGLEMSIRRAWETDPVGRIWYRTRKAALNPDAVRYIDNLLAQTG
jgi:hypothetical protein